MASFSYDVSVDFPGGAVNAARLVEEIRASAITVAVDRVDVSGGVRDGAGRTVGGVAAIVFRADLPAGDKTILDGDETAPAGGLIAAHDDSPSAAAARPVAVANKPGVHVRRPDGLEHNRVYGFSINLCDKTTWRSDATKVEDEAVGTGDGATVDFNLAHGANANAAERILDLSHGKVSEEDDIPNWDGAYRAMGDGYKYPDPDTDPNCLAGPLSGFVPIVKVGGVEHIERAFGADSGGDYEIDYVTGTITFYQAPADGAAITATYYYVPEDGCACVVVVPAPGRKAIIDRVEVQASDDVELADTIVMNVYAGAAPPNGQPIRRPTYVKTMWDLINWAHGSYPQIEPHGGAAPRGMGALKVNIHSVEYMSSIPLLSSQLMYMRVHLENGVEFPGTWAAVVIYGIDAAE